MLRPRAIVKNRWTAKHYTILGFAVVTAGVLMTCAVVFRGNLADIFRASQVRSDATGRIFTVRNLSGKEDEPAFRLAIPASWKVDPHRKAHLQATVALTHTETEAWLAIAVQDYGQQRPREAELIRNAQERLEAHFKDGLELANKTFKSQLAGEDCVCLRFRGMYNAVTWFGECYMLAHHGIGYWFFIATGTRWDKGEDAAWYKSELERAKCFALTTHRKGWTEQPLKMDTFRNQEGYLSVTVPSGAWEKNNAKDVEETGELLLLGRFLKEKDNRKNATILIFTADQQSDLKESLRAARAYLERRKQEENDKYKYLPLLEGVGDTTETVGDRLGAVTELKLHLGDEPTRYTLLAVVHHEAKAHVIRCECQWEHRQIWHQEFRNALATLKFAPKQ
ncbi:MAG: hypothetical protein NZO58_07550 [Gemmataceae bacterium]|nr:hypothetical protein [Gemmataceae bacterium]